MNATVSLICLRRYVYSITDDPVTFEIWPHKTIVFLFNLYMLIDDHDFHNWAHIGRFGLTFFQYIITVIRYFLVLFTTIMWTFPAVL